jgi:AraC-like DNA-binding protein
VLYRSYRPRAPLSEYVEHIWLVSGGQMPRRERILPSGTVELVFNLHDDQVRIDGTVQAPRARTCAGAAVSGTYSGAFIINAMQHAAMMGVHFKPGGAYVVLGVPCSELADDHVDLAALWGDAAAREVRERLCTAATHPARFEYLEALLTSRLQCIRSLHPIVPFALRCFTSTGVAPRIQDVAREFGLSHRRLLTVFEAQVGLPPKLFCRIRRFQQVHALAQRTGDVDWARVALACGFFDQPHLTNEFQRLCGLSPTEYENHLRERRNLLSGHVAIP